MSDVRGSFWIELDEILSGDFTGQIVLHVSQGQIKTYDVVQRRPVQSNGDDALPPLDRRTGKL